ncbi:MAG TPA: glycosyltransferase family 4 protein [Planctomycetota bacterium]|nr:glycosyltransferase family 4 protein [Planctomycetota bacterium]
MLVACVNQDPGIMPTSRKGAAVHVESMRRAFRAVGARVAELDEKDEAALDARLTALLSGRTGPALVYERYALGCVTASRVAARHERPHVLEVNAPLIEEAARYRTSVDADRLRGLEHEVFDRARAIIAVSQAVAESVFAHGLPAERVLVRPNAVDTALFRAVGRPSLPPGVTIAPTDFVLGFHGRLRPWHGFPRLVGAFRRLLEKRLPVHLLLVGEGDWEQGLRDDASTGAAPLAPGCVTVLGWRPQEELAAIVARFDALALAYDGDAPCYFSPLKLLEAMAVGAVPVVPALGDLPRIVRHDESGLVYAPGDEVALAAQIERLVRTPALRVRLGITAAREARSRSWTAIARDVLAVVATPAAGRP